MKRILPFHILLLTRIHTSFAQNFLINPAMVSFANQPIRTIGISEIIVPSFTFHCFPNPSNHELSISSHKDELYDLRIITLQGKSMRTQPAIKTGSNLHTYSQLKFTFNTKYIKHSFT
ncbi:MAG: hypothetical protein V4651_03690 [Bacteroidota bacterium]